jgi:hypothetical protein
MKKFYSITFLMFIVVAAWSQTRVWNGGNGMWNDATKWTPVGTPVSSDILGFNGTSATISNTPNLTLRGIIITGSNIVLNSAGSGPKNLTIGYSVDDTAIIINADASFTIGNDLNIVLANNSRAAVDGTLIVGSGCNYYTNAGVTTKTVVNGVVRNSGNIMSVVSMLDFGVNAMYEHARDSGVIPSAFWNTNSTCQIEGVVMKAPVGLEQSFGNYVWDCEHQAGGAFMGNAIPSDIKGNLVINKAGSSAIFDPTIYLLFPGQLKVEGSFILNSGTCLTREPITTIDIKGDCIINGGALKTNSAQLAAGLHINFKGSQKQRFVKTTGIFNVTRFNILNDAFVDFGESVLEGHAEFILAAGGGLATAHPQGISLTGAAGAIQVTGKRSFSSNADYAYTGFVSQITGTGLPAMVRKLIINNKAGLLNNAGVTLTEPTTVSTELVLINGFVQTSDDKILTVAEGAGCTMSDNSFVAGPIRKTGNTPFTFPTGWTGAGGGQIPIGISPKGVVTTIQAEYKRAPATNKGTTINAPLHHISYCDYWEVFPTSGNASVVVTMYRNAHSDCNPVSYINDFSAVRVARSNGIAWTEVGNTDDSLDAGNGYVVSDVDGISINTKERYFALGNITTAKDPLPVMFDNVVAYEKNDGVKIEWSNLTERDIALYFVERSVNGIDYTLISQHLPKSNRDDKASYTGFDPDPLPGVNFYRVKTIEKSTKIIFSKVMRIETGNPTEKISLYPNPVISKQFILGVAGVKEGEYNLRVINSGGQGVFQSGFINKGSFITQTFRLPAALKPGVYNLLITGDDYREIKMFIVQ